MIKKKIDGIGILLFAIFLVGLIGLIPKEAPKEVIVSLALIALLGISAVAFNKE